MFFNLEPTTNMYVDWTDFRSYTKTDVETNVAVVGAGGLTIGDFYIYARGLQNVGWTIDYMDTSTDPANKVTYRKIGNKWPMTDPLERIAVFPVKDKSQGNKVVAFYEYDCGNLVCSTPNCLEFKNTVNVATKYVCGNSIIDPGEQCDTGGGGIFTNADQLQYGTSMQNAAGQSPYVLSCNADCTRSVTRSTSVASIPGGAYEQRVLTCTPDVIPATYCGDGTIQTPNAQGINEQCELNDPTCGRVGADACKFVISNYCGD